MVKSPSEAVSSENKMASVAMMIVIRGRESAMTGATKRIIVTIHLRQPERYLWRIWKRGLLILCGLESQNLDSTGKRSK